MGAPVAGLVFVLLAGACGGGGSSAPDAAAATPDAALTGPPASAGDALVYHGGLETVVLVSSGLGGVTSPPREQPLRLWTWDGARWMLLDGAGPPIRNLAGAAYDAARDVLVLHGGSYSATLSYGETWEWRRAGGWSRVDTTAGGPGVRDHVQLAYDAARGRVVLFGGQASITSFPGDTWTFDGAWTRAATTGPAARVHHAMAYDAAAQRVMVFGGSDPEAGDRGDSWGWNGSAWSELGAATTARTHARMSFDDELGALVVVGGLSAADGVLVRQGDAWRRLASPGEPPARYLPALAYDAHRGVLVMFGGGDPRTDALSAETWEHDGASWARR